MDGKRRRITFLYLQFVNVLTCKMIQVGRCERSSSSCHITDTDDLGNFGPPSFRVDLQDAQTPPYMLPSGTWLPRSQPCELSRACARVTDRHTHTHTHPPSSGKPCGTCAGVCQSETAKQNTSCLSALCNVKAKQPKDITFLAVGGQPEPQSLTNNYIIYGRSGAVRGCWNVNLVLPSSTQDHPMIPCDEVFC